MHTQPFKLNLRPKDSKPSMNIFIDDYQIQSSYSVPTKPLTKIQTQKHKMRTSIKLSTPLASQSNSISFTKPNNLSVKDIALEDYFLHINTNNINDGPYKLDKLDSIRPSNGNLPQSPTISDLATATSFGSVQKLERKSLKIKITRIKNNLSDFLPPKSSLRSSLSSKDKSSTDSTPKSQLLLSPFKVGANEQSSLLLKKEGSFKGKLSQLSEITSGNRGSYQPHSSAINAKKRKEIFEQEQKRNYLSLEPIAVEKSIEGDYYSTKANESKVSGVKSPTRLVKYLKGACNNNSSNGNSVRIITTPKSILSGSSPKKGLLSEKKQEGLNEEKEVDFEEIMNELRASTRNEKRTKIMKVQIQPRHESLLCLDFLNFESPKATGYLSYSKYKHFEGLDSTTSRWLDHN